MSLSAAANVLVPAYLVLQSKGYQVSRLQTEETEFWIAEGNGHRFVADSTIDLLGVIAVYEARGENWPASDEDLEMYMKHFPS